MTSLFEDEHHLYYPSLYLSEIAYNDCIFVVDASNVALYYTLSCNLFFSFKGKLVVKVLAHKANS